jgi:hypothetical protein
VRPALYERRRVSAHAYMRRGVLWVFLLLFDLKNGCDQVHLFLIGDARTSAEPRDHASPLAHTARAGGYRELTIIWTLIRGSGPFPLSQAATTQTSLRSP